MKAHSRMFMKSLKPNWKLPEGYLEMAEASQERLSKRDVKIKAGGIEK